VKTYRVRLTDDERHTLEALVVKGRAAARTLTHARILLKVDEGPTDPGGEPDLGRAGGPGWSDGAVVHALDVSEDTVQRVRRRCVEEGPLAALARRPRRSVPRCKLDGRAEAHLVALSCSAPPDGREGWSLRLLADRMVELEYVDCLSYETVRRTLKKTR
jgi:hypothetical protein